MAGATCKNTRIIIIIPSSPMNCSAREITPASSSTQETKEQELPKLRTSGTLNVTERYLAKYFNFSISQEDVPIGKKNQLGVCGSRETKERSLMKLFCKVEYYLMQASHHLVERWNRTQLFLWTRTCELHWTVVTSFISSSQLREGVKKNL